MKGARSVFVVAAHPDDEVLGCGGTIARHTASGDDVHVLILGEGIMSRYESNVGQSGCEDLQGLRASAEDAMKALDVREVTFESFPDNRFDSIPLLEIVHAVEQVAKKIQPEIIYTHHAGDLNIDHRITLDAVLAACRPIPGSPVRVLYSFEVPSSTEWACSSFPPFLPTVFVNIEETLEKKLRAMACYNDEVRAWPHPRSLPAIEHLARWRGASAGFEAAEAFQLIRETR